ncbi:MAG: PAS domain S-box protein [Methylotenera sp.]|nr:PAS domain S-box protein [Oligoflexia bacterium]
MRTAKSNLSLIHASETVESSSAQVGKYEAIFEYASDAIVTLTLPDLTLDAANQAAEEMTGYLKSELSGASLHLLIPDSSKVHIPARSRTLSAELFKVPGTYEDIAILRNDGYVRLVDLSVRIVKNKKTELALALFRDVTEKKRMERELITKHTELKNAYIQLEKTNAELQAMQQTLVQAGKMAALGELAAGIAHELNQPLMGIRGYAQELQSTVLPSLTGHACEGEGQLGLREIISSVDKMAAIIQHLRTFTRKSTENFEMTDVHHPIEEALKMLSRQFASRGIAVKRNFSADLASVYANPLQLEQVFINLATNARDAIEQTQRGTGHVEITTADAGDFIEVSFKDDGVGMNDRTQAKAFNPFFTTKEVGKGMGLGLSLSYGMISKLQGSIVVKSEMGKGTEFLIRLPKDYRELA